MAEGDQYTAEEVPLPERVLVDPAVAQHVQLGAFGD